MKKPALIFIGEISEKAEIRITRKPRFSDAALLSRQLPQLPKNSPYQTIRLSDEGDNSICFCGKDIQITYQPRSLQITKKNRELSEEEVFDAVNNFILKEGNCFSVLGTFPSKKAERAELKKRWKISAQREVTKNS